MKIKLIFFFVAILSLTTNCGFKVLDKSEKNNFSVQEVRSSGEMRINHKIKNNILINSKDTSENQVIINLNTKKIKNIKEKNIKNEITKYQIGLTSNVEFFLIKGDVKASFIKLISFKASIEWLFFFNSLSILIIVFFEKLNLSMVIFFILAFFVLKYELYPSL